MRLHLQFKNIFIHSCLFTKFVALVFTLRILFPSIEFLGKKGGFFHAFFDFQIGAFCEEKTFLDPS